MSAWKGSVPWEICLSSAAGKGSTNGVMDSARKGAMNENPPATEGDIFGSLRTCEG